LDPARTTGTHRRRIALLLFACGTALMVWAVFAFCAAALGGPPDEILFANRRPYDEVKRSVHAAFPGLLLRGLGGLLLLRLGVLLRRDA
jgi:hypothetical protein